MIVMSLCNDYYPLHLRSYFQQTYMKHLQALKHFSGICAHALLKKKLWNSFRRTFSSYCATWRRYFLPDFFHVMEHLVVH
ncbi:unnamed protein product, partial [Brassica oleracea]